MKRLGIEFIVGLFLLVGFLCFFYLAIKMGDLGLFAEDSYTVNAKFTSTSGLKEGAFVELAGVRIGKVLSIELDPESYESVVQLSIPRKVQIQEDSIASIRTSGIIGDKFVKITPGGLEEYIQAGGDIIETEAAIDIEELVSKYIFEGQKDEN